MMKRISLAILLVSVLILAGCSANTLAANSQPASSSTVLEKTSEASSSYRDISVSDLQAELENKNFTLINVHVPHQRDIPKTDLVIPYDQIEQNLNQLPLEKDAKIVLYCSSGHMSGIAAEKLASLGYTNVWSLEGGMSAWEKAGLPVDRKQ
jgi:rhodanese-related sulfurtransferase